MRIDVIAFDGLDELDLVGHVGLHLVERLVGPDAAEAAARRMEYTRHTVLVIDED